jgi:plasmid stabilization system protein ParE
MKRWRVFLTRQAEQDANELWRLIAEDNPQAAEAFLDAIEAVSSLLSATPEIGSPRYFSHPELQGSRFLPPRRFEKYLLFYRTLRRESGRNHTHCAWCQRLAEALWRERKLTLIFYPIYNRCTQLTTMQSPNLFTWLQCRRYIDYLPNHTKHLADSERGKFRLNAKGIIVVVI